VATKRSERLLKKLKNDNYENIWSIPEKTFFHLLKYFINENIKPILNPKIANEIIYRIENNILDKRSVAIIISAPNSIEELKIFKEIIKSKQEEIIVY
jgi:hypothetical protein